MMCLSLWAYYIQIKGGFTDRRQAPAPTSNQTVPPGNRVARTYVATASQHDTAMSSRSPPRGSWEAGSQSAAL